MLAVGALSLLMACGGSGGLDPTPVHSESFSPAQATTAAGDPAPLLWWIYRINGGAPIMANLNGIQLSATFNDFLVTLDTTAAVRRAEGDGRINAPGGGPHGGNYTIELSNNVRFGSTFFLDESLRIILNLNAGSGTVRLDANVIGVFNPELEWFLDRDDLDLLPEGFQQSLGVDVDVTGSVTVSGTGLPPTAETISSTDFTNDTWTIVSKESSITVLGRTYTNIVVVDRDTIAINPQSGLPEPVTIRYWVAKGIGFVQAQNLLSFVNVALFWELVDTNLVQP